MAARSKPLEELTAADLGLDEAEVGLAGSRQEVFSVEAAEERKSGEIVVDAATAKSAHLSIGSKISVIANTPPEPFTV